MLAALSASVLRERVCIKVLLRRPGSEQSGLSVWGRCLGGSDASQHKMQLGSKLAE